MPFSMYVFACAITNTKSVAKNNKYNKFSVSNDSLQILVRMDCAKEKYWNSTSSQTIVGKLHLVGVAV